MQEKVQKFSPIKQRILQFIEYLQISKREFYAETGISRGTLESSTSITEETLAKFIDKYQNISPAWLLLGDGEIIQKPEENKLMMAHEPAAKYYKELKSLSCEQCELRERLLEAKEETIKALRAIIRANNIKI